MPFCRRFPLSLFVFVAAVSPSFSPRVFADPFAGHPTLAGGIKFYYPMNEASGTMADAIGSFGDMSVGGGAVGDAGPAGGPLDGSYAYKWVHDTDFSFAVGPAVGHPTLNVNPGLSSDSASFTLMLWVYCDGDLDPEGVTDNAAFGSDNKGNFALLGWGTPDHNYPQLGMTVTGGGDDFRAMYRNGSGTVVENSPDPDGLEFVNPLQWNLFGISYDDGANALKWWVNGNEVASLAVTDIDHDLNESGRFQLARYMHFNWEFNGYLNGFAMWDRALAAAEFGDLWNSGGGLVYDASGSFDTTPPSVPGGLAASNISETGFTLSWNASTDSESGVANYKVYVDGVPDQTVTATSAAISGLDPNTQYDLTVSAVDGADNESGQSTALEVTTLADSTPPSVPANLALETKTATSVAFSWSASTDDLSGVANYHVYLDDVYNQTASATSATVNGLSADTEYGFKVSAVDGATNESAKSQELLVTTNASSGGPFGGHSTLDSGIKFYYPMNEASGTMADATGNFGDMSAGGGAVGDAGPAGGPLDGSYAYKWVHDTDYSGAVGPAVGHPTLDINPGLASDSASFTLMIWAYCDGDLDPEGVTDNTAFGPDNKGNFALLGWGTPDHNYPQLGMTVTGGDDFRATYRNGSGTVVHNAPDPDGLEFVNPLQWNLFGISYDDGANALKWWVNGNEVASLAVTDIDHDLNESGRFQLARYMHFNWEFNGYLNGFAMWDRALAAAEFGDLWNSGGGLVYDASGSPDTTPPSAPSNLVWTEFTDESVTFVWDASTDDGPGPITYTVFPDDGDTAVPNVTITGTQAGVEGLAPGTGYGFRVKAYDAASNPSAYSSTLGVLTNTPPEFDDVNYDLAKSTDAGVLFSLDLDDEFLDADSDPLAFSIPGLSGGMIGWLTWDGEEHTLSGTPSYSELGLLEVTVVADDGFTVSPPEFQYGITVTTPVPPTADEDNDGMYDLWELDNGLDPGNPADALIDNDGDLLTNLEEFLLDTDPNSAASNDLDSIPDDWEAFYGLDTTPGQDSSQDDVEPDGLNNASEFGLGTDPTKRDHPDLNLIAF